MKPSTTTFKDFCMSGRFTTRESFLKKFPSTKLNDSCTDVVRYMGDLYVEALKTNEFTSKVKGVRRYSSNSLDKVEAYIWNNLAHEMFNGEKVSV